jgi:hypothetical protein
MHRLDDTLLLIVEPDPQGQPYQPVCKIGCQR